MVLGETYSLIQVFKTNNLSGYHKKLRTINHGAQINHHISDKNEQ